jgi:CheY-like chemotaxis protein
MKILVVDDSAMIRRILRQELEEAGFEVFEAVDGKDALEKAAALNPYLITMDVDMPRMNGYDVVYKIRTELKLTIPGTERAVPIVMVTANDTLEGRRKGFQVGAGEFVIKPFLKGEVASVVNNLLLPDTTLQGMTALIVEDSDLARSILVNVLTGQGIIILQATNGVEAVEMLKNRDHQIDIVLTDYMMPEMDGDELCRRIRFDLGRKNLPIIFLTALSESASMLKIFKAGASDYLVKPFAKEELLARVRVHLESQRLNNKLTEQVIELKRLSKLKDDILSITSHDLRSPITGILGFTDLLMSDDQLTEQHLEYLAHVKDSADFLLTLIADILELGRAQSIDNDLVFHHLSLLELIGSSINTVNHMAGPKEISIQVENEYKSDPLISADKNAMIRIINNLLSNAIKFTPNKGQVIVKIGQQKENLLDFSIIDNGIGIEEKMIPKLFDKYSKASRPGTAGEKSTGLGLSITKTMIEQHGGTISVSSQVGEGTTFLVRFPLIADRRTPVKKKPVAPSAISANKSVNILIVEDNQLNIKLVKTVLGKRGYEVTIAEDGKKAVDAYIISLQENKKQFDIIFMDLRMPVMDGFEATIQIREFEEKHQLSPIPIVAMTATTADDSWKEKAQELGLNGIVSKPMNIRDIEESIHRFTTS